MRDDLNFMVSGACGRDGCTCIGSRSSTDGGTTSGSDDDSDSAMSTYTTYTMADLSEATGISTEKLAAMDDSELEALAESVLEDDSDDDGGGDGGDEPLQLDELSEAVREKLAEVVAKAREAGVDLAELGLDELFDLDDLPEGEAAASALAADGGSGSGGVTYTSNTKKVAQATGLPMNWEALAGIDLPPSLADVPMSDRGLAAAINKAHDVDGPGDRVATASLVGQVRDKGSERGSFGVQVEDFESDDAGLDNKLGEESPLPAKTVKNRVESHLSRTGQRSPRDAAQSGVSLEDVDGE